MSKILVLDTNKQPLYQIHPAQARQLLRNQKAAVFRRFPFTIILKEPRTESPISPLRLKIDPGAKMTGIVLVNDSTVEVVLAVELKHRGFVIRDALTSRRQLRRGRRATKTRYSKPRFLNRTGTEGWLAPSLQSRIDNIKTWVHKLCIFAPIVNTTRFALLEALKATGLSVEIGSGGLTKFNRSQQNLEKTHWLDASCVGESTPILNIKGIKQLLIIANGHGNRQMCGTDKFGFSIRYRTNKQIHFGSKTGDIVKAVVTGGKKMANMLDVFYVVPQEVLIL